MIAHVAGLPLEEILLPLLSMGGACLIAVRASASRWRGQSRVAEPVSPTRS